MIQRICDRCGREAIDEKWYEIRIQGMERCFQEGCRDDYDLCPQCFEELKMFLGKHKGQIKLGVEE